MAPFKPKPRQPPMTKAELRAQGIQALAQVTTPIIKLPMKIRRQCDTAVTSTRCWWSPGKQCRRSSVRPAVTQRGETRVFGLKTPCTAAKTCSLMSELGQTRPIDTPRAPAASPLRTESDRRRSKCDPSICAKCGPRLYGVSRAQSGYEPKSAYGMTAQTQEHFDVRKELGQSADRRAEHRRASVASSCLSCGDRRKRTGRSSKGAFSARWARRSHQDRWI